MSEDSIQCNLSRSATEFTVSLTEHIKSTLRVLGLESIAIIHCDRGTAPTSSFRLLVDFVWNEARESVETALSWDSIVRRVRPCTLQESEPRQSFLHVVIHAMLRVAASLHEQGPVLPKIQIRAQTRHHTNITGFIRFPMYPPVVPPARCPLHHHHQHRRRLFMRMDREVPYYGGGRRVAQLAGRRGPPYGRRCCRRLRNIG